MAPALVHIAQGGGQVIIRLAPVELGTVDIRIQRHSDGAAAVQVTVGRPETLRLLLNDQPQLQRALDIAGVPADGRTLTMVLATPEAAPTPAQSGGTEGGNFAGGNGGNSGADPGSGRGGGYNGGQSSHRYQGATVNLDPEPSPAWLRAGVDITA